jgi:hypothetical protein
MGAGNVAPAALMVSAAYAAGKAIASTAAIKTVDRMMSP